MHAIETVFVEERVADSPVTKGVLSRLPDTPVEVVKGRRFHKDIAREIIGLDLPSHRDSLSEKPYEELCVSKLEGKYGPRAVQFVAQVGAKKAGWATRGEACALAKKYLFLTYTDLAVLVKPSERTAKDAPRRIRCCDYVQLNPISSCPFQCLYCFESDLRGYD